MINRRSSGILLHVTSLPSAYGIGDLGPAAYEFVDALAQARQSLWQILPLNPTTALASHSPYSCTSAFAGNMLLISPEMLVRDGLLEPGDLANGPEFAQDRVDYLKVLSHRTRVLELACDRFEQKGADGHFQTFCWQMASWLEDFATFIAIRHYQRGQPWHQWPARFRDRQPEAMQAIRQELAGSIQRIKFLQYLFHRQWLALRHYCNQRGVQIIGDMPIYVAYDSADVWAHPEVFQLDRYRNPLAVSGMPSSRFNRRGQLWGTPLYAWDWLKENGYRWWLDRIAQNMYLFDRVRLDHFLGLVSYWRVPAEARNAVHGQWMKGPREDFFRAVFRRFASLPLVAEDLGFVSAESRELMARYGLPGMRVLIDAFASATADNRFAPHNHIPDCFVYTGTHDNNTVRGWFEFHARAEEKQRFFDYIGREAPLEDVPWEFVTLALRSVANGAILQMQDVLGLSQEARMNRPGTVRGNWRWRLLPGQFAPELIYRLAHITELFGRA